MGDKTDRAKGKVKKAAGSATGNPRLKAHGKDDTVKGNLKKSGKALKNAAKNA